MLCNLVLLLPIPVFYTKGVSHNMWANEPRGGGLCSQRVSLVPLEIEVQLKINVQLADKPSTQHDAIYQSLIHAVLQRDVRKHAPQTT